MNGSMASREILDRENMTSQLFGYESFHADDTTIQNRHEVAIRAPIGSFHARQHGTQQPGQNQNEQVTMKVVLGLSLVAAVAAQQGHGKSLTRLGLNETAITSLVREETSRN